MSDSSSSQAGGGIGFLGLLTIVFIAFCFAMAVIVRVYEAVK